MPSTPNEMDGLPPGNSNGLVSDLEKKRLVFSGYNAELTQLSGLDFWRTEGRSPQLLRSSTLICTPWLAVSSAMSRRCEGPGDGIQGRAWRFKLNESLIRETRSEPVRSVPPTRRSRGLVSQ